MDFIILAGGNSTRINSSIPKIFQEIAGKPCISYVIDCCLEITSPQNVIVVTKQEFANHELFKGLQIAIQKDPLGTGDALKCAIPFLKNESVVVVCADTPLLLSEHFNQLLLSEKEASLIAMRLPDELIHMQYGRIIDGKVVEYNEIPLEEKKNNLVNSGIYKFNTNFLKSNIDRLSNNNSKNEYYITDILQNSKTEIFISDDYWTFHGINTQEDLVNAEKIMQDRLRKKMTQNGARLLDPDTVYFSAATLIEKDAIVEQNVIFKGRVTVKSGAIIKAFSYIEDCVIEKGAKIGPFARIRGNSNIAENSEIGNFVEIKSSIIGRDSKAKHLAYIGDSEVGESVNIGAGTITCNYDGVRKHKTVIKDKVMVGANCSLVAPITLGTGTVVGAGSTITEDTKENTLAIARARQQNKETNPNGKTE
ncbi:MAG: bifunctional UDP-N-acetylglucosamine diphosphorylase/glucosamine-1-phosphate N-acetyltransferase GlmU [Holosporales bacterium]|jgi:bifunctional UDP-N-acetylglucosamine pyrophosphorylase/glucosamine-1-phosphate N-acetyltransferase|nr:bifunctional UDP-N-acetylglucosamine diphosphorylase/glucosamine-1-phosphate N-acetyltransferase GlmU [Holosporales bacterium]